MNEYKNDEKVKTNDKTHHEENWNVFFYIGFDVDLEFSNKRVVRNSRANIYVIF